MALVLAIAILETLRSRITDALARMTPEHRRIVLYEERVQKSE